MDIEEAAALMGMKPSEVIGVGVVDGVLTATTHDGQTYPLSVRVGRIEIPTVELVAEPVEEPPGDATEDDDDEPVGDDTYPAEGNAGEVLMWVNHDPERAQYAWDAEHELRDQPRVTLLAKLGAIIDSAATED